MMAAFKRHFRALANGGISPLEATRREEALKLNAPARELPPSLIAERFRGNVIPIADPKVLSGAPETAGKACTGAVTAGETATSFLGDGDTVELVAAADEQLVPVPEWSDDELKAHARSKWQQRYAHHPVVTITITGGPRSGKSVLSHVLISALAAEGIVVTVEGELRPIRWRGRGGALDNLIDRGVSVVLVKRESEGEVA